VVGSVTATIKHPALVGHKLLVCVPVDASTGRPGSGRVVGVDTVQAGTGDTVLVIDEGNAARRILGDSRAPVRTVIAAIVDSVDAAAAEGGNSPGTGRQRQGKGRKS
jgi:microcompartment protein CcmK/EutM